MRIIDLSAPLVDLGDSGQDRIEYINHVQSLETFAKRRGISPEDLPDRMYCAVENVVTTTHSKTHLDAPWHYGPFSEGKPAKTVDQVPLEWCYNDGVVLDFSSKRRGEIISRADIEGALEKIGYALKPFDIVLIRTDASRHIGKEGYENLHAGMSREATLYLIDCGIKVMGIDAWGWDRPFDVMMKEYNEGNKDGFWAAHFAGREREFCHMENLVNLDLLPRPYGFKVCAFPIKISRASAAWVRAVAIIDE